MTQNNTPNMPPGSGSPFSFETSEAGEPVMTVDYDAYAHFLEDSDLSEDEKRALLQSLWNVIVECVSMGFGVHPMQQAKVIEVPFEPESLRAFEEAIS